MAQDGLEIKPTLFLPPTEGFTPTRGLVPVQAPGSSPIGTGIRPKIPSRVPGMAGPESISYYPVARPRAKLPPRKKAIITPRLILPTSGADQIIYRYQPPIEPTRQQIEVQDEGEDDSSYQLRLYFINALIQDQPTLPLSQVNVQSHMVVNRIKYGVAY